MPGTRGKPLENYRTIALLCGCSRKFRCPLPQYTDALWCAKHKTYTSRKKGK